MFFAKIPRHIRQNAITEGDLECILTRNCEGTEQLQKIKNIRILQIGPRPFDFWSTIRDKILFRNSL